MFDTFRQIGLAGLVDIGVMALLVYSILVWIKRTRAAFVLTGIIIVFGIYLLTRQFNLVLTATIFENFFAIILIALVVIFQEELRHFFERVAILSFNPRLRFQGRSQLSREESEILVRTLTDLAKERIGALIVLKGKDILVRHLEGGIRLGGEISEALLKSIFDPHSIGHDGAVVIEKKKVMQFAVYLPLSKNLRDLGKGGTRHAAALGLSELSDALCLVVSEERGTISAARHGNIETVKSAETLAMILERFFQETDPRKETRPWQDFFKQNSQEKIVAFLLAFAFWFVFAHGSEPASRAVLVPVTPEKLSSPWNVEVMGPKEVEVIFRGPRKAFYFWGREKVKMSLGVAKEEGMHKIRLSPQHFSFPKDLVLESIKPDEIRLNVDNTQTGNG